MSAASAVGGDGDGQNDRCTHTVCSKVSLNSHTQNGNPLKKTKQICPLTSQQEKKKRAESNRRVSSTFFSSAYLNIQMKRSAISFSHFHRCCCRWLFSITYYWDYNFRLWFEWDDREIPPPHIGRVYVVAHTTITIVECCWAHCFWFACWLVCLLVCLIHSHCSI